MDDYIKSKEIYEKLGIAQLKCDKDKFYLTETEPNFAINITPYISLNSYYNDNIVEYGSIGYKLNVGDIIKIGRYRIKVRGISEKKQEKENIIKNKIEDKRKSDNNDKEKNNDNITLSENRSLSSKSDLAESRDLPRTKDIICKICYTSNKDSPLISPCNCTGSLKYIHLNCLHQWLKSKINIYYKNDINLKINAYRLEPVKCEICKEFFPDFVKLNDTLYEICNFNILDENEINEYNMISLETLESQRNLDKYIYNIYYKKCVDNYQYEIKIGRGNNCEIKLSNEPTISREHSSIIISSEGIYLKDLNSKYGTCILLQNKNFQFLDNAPISIEFGRSLISFFLEKKNILKRLLCCRNTIEEGNYEEINKKGINFEEGYIVKKQEIENEDNSKEEGI